MQADDTANPGLLWVERGEKLWNARAGSTANELRVVPWRRARVDARGGSALSSLRRGHRRSARPRGAHQRLPHATAAGRQLAARVGRSALADGLRRLPVARHCRSAVAIDGDPRAAFERGRAFYTQRHGQMNLACTQCHDQNWGKRLLAETISQGHGNAFPAYRLEWQGLGSLQRRIRACLFGIRAEMPPPGTPELTDVELYLGVARAGAAARNAWRAAVGCQGSAAGPMLCPPGRD